jgi:hypothetical protein
MSHEGTPITGQTARSPIGLHRPAKFTRPYRFISPQKQYPLSMGVGYLSATALEAHRPTDPSDPTVLLGPQKLYIRPIYGCSTLSHGDSGMG